MKALLRPLALACLLLLAPEAISRAEPSAVEMWRSPGCSCCAKWAAHLRGAGYGVTIKDAASGILAKIKRDAGIGEKLASCHTAHIGDYVVEGHVPVEDIQRLLREKPDAIGLAMPGMPIGSPGMESGDTKEPYEVILMKKDGTSEVWARH